MDLGFEPRLGNLTTEPVPQNISAQLYNCQRMTTFQASLGIQIKQTSVEGFFVPISAKISGKFIDGERLESFVPNLFSAP